MSRQNTERHEVRSHQSGTDRPVIGVEPVDASDGSDTRRAIWTMQDDVLQYWKDSTKIRRKAMAKSLVP